MKKAVFFYSIFLVHACSLLTIDFGDVVNVGGAFLTGGPSAAAGAAIGSAGGDAQAGYDMSGFDAGAGGASGAAAFDPSGFEPMSDVQISQMREIANSMPATAPTAGYTGYDPSQQTQYPTAAPQGTYDTGYPTQAPVAGASDFFTAAPVDYSVQPQVPSGMYQPQMPLTTYPPTQQFDAMGNQIPPQYAVPPAPIGYAQQPLPPATPAYAPSTQPPAPDSDGSSSPFDEVGGAGGASAIGLAGAGVLGASGVAVSRRTPSNSKDVVTLPPNQARFADRIPLIAEADVEWGKIIRTVDGKGITTLRIKRISKSNPIDWARYLSWSSEEKAQYNANIAQSKEKLAATNERNSGIVSSGYGIGANAYKLSESDVKYGELYDTYDEKGRPTKKIKKPDTFARLRLTPTQQAEYEKRKAESEEYIKDSKAISKQIANPLLRQQQYRTVARPTPMPYGASMPTTHPARMVFSTTPQRRTYPAGFSARPANTALRLPAARPPRLPTTRAH